MWDHALAVSLVARTLATEYHYPKVEEASIAGLMHDIGKVVIEQHLGKKYKGVTDLVRNEGIAFLEAEHRVLGFTHTEIGGMVIRKWKFSPYLEEAVILHHNPQGAKINPTLCAIVSLANDICVKLGRGPEWTPDLDLPELDSTRMLNLDKEHTSRLLESIEEQFASDNQVGMPVASARVAQSLAPPSPVCLDHPQSPASGLSKRPKATGRVLPLWLEKFLRFLSKPLGC